MIYDDFLSQFFDGLKGSENVSGFTEEQIAVTSAKSSFPKVRMIEPARSRT